MEDCYYNSPGEEKMCKYSYASWCPTCERSSPRRRSKSETVECRRRCKEMKTPTRKFSRSQEHENIEYDPPDYWCEPRPLRSNQLCELPTSYIANNCQTSKPLPTENVRTFEPPLKMKQEDFMEVLKYDKSKHLNVFTKKQHREGPNYYDSHLSYNTSTYFDKVRDAATLNARYLSEIEAVRERIAALKNSGNRVEVRVQGTVKCAPGQAEQKRLEKAGALSSVVQGEVANRPKKVALKTKKPNVTRLRKSRQNSARSSAGKRVADIAESDYSGSDESGAEEVHADDESESVGEVTCTAGSGVETEGAHSQTGGDTAGWPTRASLFPHIPPYIRFNTHDAQIPFRLPAGRRFFKWKLSTITPIVVRTTLTNSGFVMVRKSNQWLGTWGKHMKSPMFQTLKEMQKLNHFPGTFQLGRKDRLWRNFQKLILKHGYKEFGFIPHSYILPQELKILKQHWDYKTANPTQAWIIKPPASARGVGIKVINKWSQLPKKTALVVQKYISNPYLINGSKFDLRLYVLVTSFNPLRIYLYPEGLARFASAKYSEDAKDFKDRFVHLTNYSINKHSSQYTANEDANACQGHKWTITKLLEYLTLQGVDTKALWKNLQQLVIKTMISAESPINQLCDENMLSRYNCYELFGVDVLLDDKLKPWLLEVNISPSLHSASPLDTHVKGPLVQLLFDMAQFHFPPRLSQTVPDSPKCFEPKLYTTALTNKERQKHTLFEQYESRNDYLEDILKELTGDDVRKLTQAEDELTVKGTFERIFPTAQTFRYLNFMEARYYNRLFDSWETKYEKDRQAGVNRLRTLCSNKVHLKVAPQSTLNKNLPNTTLGCVNLQPSKEGQSRPPNEIQQETIQNTSSCN